MFMFIFIFMFIFTDGCLWWEMGEQWFTVSFQGRCFIIIVMTFDSNGTAPWEYSHNFNETSGQYGTTWNIEQLEKYKCRKNPGDDIWLQAWQPTSVLIAMEHRGKTTPLPLPQTYLPKFSFQTECDAGWKYGRPVQKDWSRQVHGRLLRAACPPS